MDLPERSFSHFAITVSRIDDALRIYRDILGFTHVSFTSVADAPSFREIGLKNATMNMLFLERDGVVIELQEVVLADGTPPSPDIYTRGMRLIAFAVADVEPAIANVVAGGGSFDPKTMQGSGANAMAFCRDPENNRVEFVAGDRGGRKDHKMMPDEGAGIADHGCELRAAILRARQPAGLSKFYADRLHMSTSRSASGTYELTMASMYYGDHLGWRNLDAQREKWRTRPTLRLEIAPVPKNGTAGLEGFVFRARDPRAITEAIDAERTRVTTRSDGSMRATAAYEHTLFHFEQLMP